MEYEIKRINTWPIVKIVFLFSFIFGAFIGISYAFILSFINSFFQYFNFEDITVQAFNTNEIFFLIIFTAIFTAVISCIISIILVGVYNLSSRWIGGIKLELKSSET